MAARDAGAAIIRAAAASEEVGVEKSAEAALSLDAIREERNVVEALEQVAST